MELNSVVGILAIDTFLKLPCFGAGAETEFMSMLRPWHVLLTSWVTIE